MANPFACSDECDPSSNDSNECEICYGDIVAAPDLECGHSFCRMCWNQYLTMKIVDEGRSQQLVCMKPRCNVAVNDDMILDIITDDEVRLKYKYFMTKNFVQVRE